jgi:predicted outer membrane repeat protein
MITPRARAAARIIGISAVCGLFTTHAYGQTTYYVDADGPNDGNCLDWATACRDLQSALDLAQSGDQIWIAEGVYRPSRRTDAAIPRSATFELISGVALYGGFAGGETNVDQRNPALHVARLTGVLDDEFAGNAYHVISSIGVAASTIVDGVTITGGRADGVCCEQDRGGGVYNSGGSPIFIGCAFRDNFGLMGGAVYSSLGSPIIRHCTFHQNAAGVGGGVHLALNSAIAISGCHFEDNESSTNGGALDFRQGSAPVVSDSEFINNRAALGGAIFEIQSHGDVIDCYFESNRAVRGGALYGGGEPGVKVTGCTFVANRADEEGGAARVHGRQDFDRCTFLGNRAEIRGGALLYIGTDPVITNSLFSGNQAQLAGGAISVDASTLYIINSTLNRNHALPINDSGTCCIEHITPGCSDAVCQEAVCAWDQYCCSTIWDAPCVDRAFDFAACDCGGPQGFGGGVHLANNSRVTFSSSIVWRSQDSGGFDESAQIEVDPTSTVIVDYTCVEGLTGALGGVGNIGSVPLFVDARGPDLIAGTLDDNLRLKKESPCIDAGHVDGEPKSGVFDLDGLPRVLCGRIDMGAYELGFGDADCSGTVNLTDFAAWMDCFEGPMGSMSPSCAAFDANVDSRIDHLDLRAFQNVFQP